MPVDQLLCESCNVVEDECHVIIHCSSYDDVRTQLFTDINNISDHFLTLSTDVQFLQIMCASRAMNNIFNRRRCNLLQYLKKFTLISGFHNCTVCILDCVCITFDIRAIP